VFRGPPLDVNNRKEASVPDVNARDAKLIQYLNEAHTKERQLEQALEAHIAMTEIATYRKRLQQHLTETKRHAREVERRIKQLGGKPEGIGGVVQEATGRAQTVAARGAALAQGQVHMLRGTGPQEKMLKNAKTEFQSEAEEIGTYTSIETLAKTVGDRETEQLAKAILREEKRMAGFLEKLIPKLTQAVAKAEIPAAQRNGGRRTTRRRRTTSRSGTARRTAARSGTARKTTARRKPTARKTTATRNGASRSTSARSPSSRSAGRRSGTARRTASSGSRSK
jgi:ferritin-like metal-binding protein YciE